MFDADGLSEGGPHRAVKNRDNRTFGLPVKPLTADWQECQKVVRDYQKKEMRQRFPFAFNHLPSGFFWASACFPRSDAGEGF
jgi:hypothetical protein